MSGDRVWFKGVQNKRYKTVLLLKSKVLSLVRDAVYILTIVGQLIQANESRISCRTDSADIYSDIE